MSTKYLTGINPELVHKFLDSLSAKLNCKNDAQLSKELEIAPPVLSKIRHMKLAVGSLLQVRIHELTGMKFSEIRDALGYEDIFKFRNKKEEQTS